LTCLFDSTRDAGLDSGQMKNRRAEKMNNTSLSMFIGRLEKELNYAFEVGGFNKDYMLAVVVAIHVLKALKRFY
jgi:hypothetical protein